jgi:hypothetical protein
MKTNRASASERAEAIVPDGLLIYRIPPWQLVSSAGFEKLKMEIDPWGIFTVSLARRREA